MVRDNFETPPISGLGRLILISFLRGDRAMLHFLCIMLPGMGPLGLATIWVYFEYYSHKQASVPKTAGYVLKLSVV